MSGPQVYHNPYLRGAIAEYVPLTSNPFLSPGAALAAAGSASLVEFTRRRWRTIDRKKSGTNHKLSQSPMSFLPPNHKRGSAYGTTIAGGPGDAGRHKKRSKKEHTPEKATNQTPSSTSSSNISSLTTKSVGTVLKAITNNAELDSHKRSTPARYRLHAAKYLKMDAMLKELMFPLHRFKGFFGFMSTSGNGLDVSVTLDDDWVGKLAPRSAFRGISFFKLRHCAPRNGVGYPGSGTDDQAKLLNASRIKIGTTQRNTGQDSEDIKTYFRRFNNTPALDNTTGAAGNPRTSATPVMTMSTAPGNYKQLWMDFNTADIVRASMQEANFLPNLTASTGQGGGDDGGTYQFVNPDVGPNPFEDSNINDGVVNVKTSLKDATVRIADGKLVMDVTNGQRIPTVVELVIHSMKKAPARGLTSTSHSRTQDIYEAIWKAANYQKSEQTAYEPAVITSTNQGGWNTFWDPKTPFLKVKGPGKKLIDDIANEVHRSIHYLAPGESKTIDIALGSLYYKLGHRSANFNGQDSSLDPQTLIDAAGTLAVAVGHFGIDQLETAFADTVPWRLNVAGSASEPASQLGAGFWVGKRPAPSQIVVSGSYEESWYPSYMNRQGRQIASQSALASHLDDYTSVGLGSIPPVQVMNTDHSNYFASVGSGRGNRAVQQT